MKAFFIPLFVIVLFTVYSFTGKEPVNPCLIMHEGTFKYKSGNGTAIVEIKGSEHMEYHFDKKYYIKSTIKWLNDCEFETTLVESTLPDFPFKPGEQMYVKINKVKGKKIYYTSMINGSKFEGVFKKIK